MIDHGRSNTRNVSFWETRRRNTPIYGCISIGDQSARETTPIGELPRYNGVPPSPIKFTIFIDTRQSVESRGSLSRYLYLPARFFKSVTTHPRFAISGEDAEDARTNFETYYRHHHSEARLAPFPSILANLQLSGHSSFATTITFCL